MTLPRGVTRFESRNREARVIFLEGRAVTRTVGGLVLMPTEFDIRLGAYNFVQLFHR